MNSLKKQQVWENLPHSAQSRLIKRLPIYTKHNISTILGVAASLIIPSIIFFLVFDFIYFITSLGFAFMFLLHAYLQHRSLLKKRFGISILFLMTIITYHNSDKFTSEFLIFFEAHKFNINLNVFGHIEQLEHSNKHVQFTQLERTRIVTILREIFELWLLGYEDNKKNEVDKEIPEDLFSQVFQFTKKIYRH